MTLNSGVLGYLTKYLTKQLGDCHHPDTGAQRDHGVDPHQGSHTAVAISLAEEPLG